MYEVRCTMEADGVCPCTTYDVRCTIWIIARQRRGNFCEAGSTWRRLWTGMTVAADAAYVRRTMYDCQVRARCAGRADKMC